TVIYKTRVRSLIFRLATLAYHRRILFTDFFSQSRILLWQWDATSYTRISYIALSFFHLGHPPSVRF
ncbi:hypothetical protein, partial [Blautia wexlerae]|uniref:hypothetical protein n=1 Tax=Blautia wexlerae TaxID=418240 RepID=UPI001A9B2781